MKYVAVTIGIASKASGWKIGWPIFRHFHQFFLHFFPERCFSLFAVRAGDSRVAKTFFRSSDGRRFRITAIDAHFLFNNQTIRILSFWLTPNRKTFHSTPCKNSSNARDFSQWMGRRKFFFLFHSARAVPWCECKNEIRYIIGSVRYQVQHHTNIPLDLRCYCNSVNRESRIDVHSMNETDCFSWYSTSLVVGYFQFR